MKSVKEEKAAAAARAAEFREKNRNQPKIE